MQSHEEVFNECKLFFLVFRVQKWAELLFQAAGVGLHRFGEHVFRSHPFLSRHLQSGSAGSGHQSVGSEPWRWASVSLLYVSVMMRESRGGHRPANYKECACYCSFRYGFSNMRYIASLISGVGIFMMGAGLSWYHGIMGLLHPEPIESLLWVNVQSDSLPLIQVIQKG